MHPQTNMIPERDVYRLIMRSKLPNAEAFEEWVVAKVLPANESSAVSPFNFEGKDVRVLTSDDGETIFIVKDVCAAIGHSNPSQAIADNVHEDDLRIAEVIDSMNRKQKMNCVTESGLYALIFGSKKPEAKRFSKWVRSKVLPSIRKMGRYEAPHKDAPAAQRGSGGGAVSNSASSAR